MFYEHGQWIWLKLQPAVLSLEVASIYHSISYTYILDSLNRMFVHFQKLYQMPGWKVKRRVAEYRAAQTCTLRLQAGIESWQYVKIKNLLSLHL